MWCWCWLWSWFWIRFGIGLFVIVRFVFCVFPIARSSDAQWSKSNPNETRNVFEPHPCTLGFEEKCSHGSAYAVAVTVIAASRKPVAKGGKLFAIKAFVFWTASTSTGRLANTCKAVKQWRTLRLSSDRFRMPVSSVRAAGHLSFRRCDCTPQCLGPKPDN